MKTGLCPRCKRRLILVTVDRRCPCPPNSHPLRPCPWAATRTVVRRHACGARIEPREVLELPVSLRGESA